MAHDVFISYANEDKTIAYAVCANLEERRIRCWIAPRDVSPGVYYAQAIINAIKESRVMVLIFSTNANKSEHVVREAEQAVRASIPIVPFRIDTSSPAEMLNYYIGPQHWLDAVTLPIEAHVQRLGDAIELLLKTSAAAPEAVVDSGQSAQARGTTEPPGGGVSTSASDELRREKKPRPHTGRVWPRRLRSRIFIGALAAAIILVIIAGGFAFLYSPKTSTPPAGTQSAMSSESPHVLGAGTLVLTASDYVSPNSTLSRGDTITIQLFKSGTYIAKDKTGEITGQYVYYPPYEPKGQNTYRLFFADPHGALIEMQPKGGFAWYDLKNTNEPLYAGQYSWSTPLQST